MAMLVLKKQKYLLSNIHHLTVKTLQHSIKDSVWYNRGMSPPNTSIT